jgi:hypothetical protein
VAAASAQTSEPPRDAFSREQTESMLLSPRLQPAPSSAHESDIVFVDRSTVVFLPRNSHEPPPRTPDSDEERLVDIGRRPPKGNALPFIPDEDEDEEADIDDTNEVSEKEEVLPGMSQGDVLAALGGEFQQPINAMMAWEHDSGRNPELIVVKFSPGGSQLMKIAPETLENTTSIVFGQLSSV